MEKNQNQRMKNKNDDACMFGDYASSITTQLRVLLWEDKMTLWEDKMTLM